MFSIQQVFSMAKRLKPLHPAVMSYWVWFHQDRRRTRETVDMPACQDDLRINARFVGLENIHYLNIGSWVF